MYNYFSSESDCLGSDTLAYLTLLGKNSDVCDYILGGINISVVTLFVDSERKELSSMPGDKSLIFLRVVDLGVLGVFGVPVVFILRLPVDSSLELPMDPC